MKSTVTTVKVLITDIDGNVLDNITVVADEEAETPVSLALRVLDAIENGCSTDG